MISSRHWAYCRDKKKLIWEKQSWNLHSKQGEVKQGSKQTTSSDTGHWEETVIGGRLRGNVVQVIRNVLSEEVALEGTCMKGRSQPCRDLGEWFPNGMDDKYEGPGVEGTTPEC